MPRKKKSSAADYEKEKNDPINLEVSRICKAEYKKNYGPEGLRDLMFRAMNLYFRSLEERLVPEDDDDDDDDDD